MERSIGRRYVWDTGLLKCWIEDNGETYQSVADRLGVSLGVVWKACKRFGIISKAARGRKPTPLSVGNRCIKSDGYVWVYVPGHPMALSNGGGGRDYVAEHRLVMAEFLGRVIEPHEVVHHKNKVRGDNRIENLELFQSKSEHCRAHKPDYAHGVREYSARGWSRLQIARHRGNIFGIIVDPGIDPETKRLHLLSLGFDLSCDYAVGRQKLPR